MIDLKLNRDWDLDINALGDVSSTSSIAQAVVIRLKWFFQEWRLGPDKGVPYYEEVLIKNPSLLRIRSRLRDTIMGVEGVKDVKRIDIAVNPGTRGATIRAVFTVGEDDYREEVSVNV